MFGSGGENMHPADADACWSGTPTSPRGAPLSRAPSKAEHENCVRGVEKAGHRCEDDIKRFALANAPAYQHPARRLFLDALPLASTNKIDRGALRRLASERRPGEADETAGRLI